MNTNSKEKDIDVGKLSIKKYFSQKDWKKRKDKLRIQKKSRINNRGK